MPDVSDAIAGYRQAMRATACPRAIEGAALLKAATDIQSAAIRAEADYPGYIAALSRNLTLWTILAADAAHPDNALPADLRGAIIRLAAYVRVQTLRLQQSRAGAGADALVEINRNIAEGLGRHARPEDRQ